MWKWQTHSVGRPGHVTDKDTRTCLWIYPQPQSSARWGPILYASLSLLVPSPLPDSFPSLPLLLPPLLCSFPIPMFISLLLPKVSFNFLSLPYCRVRSLTLPLSYFLSILTSPRSHFLKMSFTPLSLRLLFSRISSSTFFSPLLPPTRPYSFGHSFTASVLHPCPLSYIPYSRLLVRTPFSSPLLPYPLPYFLPLSFTLSPVLLSLPLRLPPLPYSITLFPIPLSHSLPSPPLSYSLLLPLTPKTASL